MKINRTLIIATALGGTFLASCGGSETENDSLESLISQRDSLKTELADLNLQISELDTAAVENELMVTSGIVERKDFVHKIEVQGAVETENNAMINAEASGVIRRVHVKEGQKVSSGQALITIDAAILSSQINEVETQLELANYMYEKQKKLMDEGVGTEIEFEQAKAQKNALESSIRTMKSQQGKTVVRAPFSGTIDEVRVSLGEMAAPGVPLLRLVDNSDVKITASISENLLGKVNVGTNVELRFPSLNDTVIDSKITSRGNFIDPTNRTFRIRIELAKNKLLLPNQLAKLSITDFSRDSALVLPSEAILQDTQNRNYVYKLKKAEDGYSVKKVFINVIKRFNGEACIESEVKGELKSNAKVVVSGAKGITETDIVKIQ
jgi:membrane fusion protein, multidrug efflux system